MRNFLTILVAAVGMQASAWTLSVPTMPVSPFADTEVSTNIPINKADISYSDLNFRIWRCDTVRSRRGKSRCLV